MDKVNRNEKIAVNAGILKSIFEYVIDNSSVDRYTNNSTEVRSVYLNDLLTEKKISKYRLAKESGIPQTTIADICSRKARIEKCSADTIYKISKALGVSMESLIEQEIESDAPQRKRPSFEVFKSNVCHLVKEKGDIDFMIDTLTTDEVRALYDRKWYAEAFYLLAMVDYLSRENHVSLCTKYDDIRTQKLQKIIYPAGVVLLDMAAKTNKHCRECMKSAIPEFLHFNIVESEVRNVY